MLAPVKMNLRSQATLGRVLDDLGATLLELVHGDADRGGDIGGVAIHDPLEEPVLPQRALVLGVGLREPAEVATLLRTLGRHDATALVLRAPLALTPELRQAADESGVALLALTRGASWAQLAALLRALLAEGDVGDAEPQTIGGMPSGDLFALANAVAALLDAPVTIEDRSSRVLAFSGRQDEADPSRVETILGRQVPEHYSRMLAERGVFRDLYRSDQPVFVEPRGEPDGFSVPRVAVAVRAGDEVLGSIWAAVREPLSGERSQALRDAARLVALHMLRIRAGADVERRLRADLLSTALEGGAGAREALHRLGLADQPVVVLALAMLPPGDESIGADVNLTSERQRLADGLAMHLTAVHPRCVAALVGDVAYGLLPVARDGDGEQRALRIATDFLDRVGDRVRAVIGIGAVAADAGGLADARAGADRALRVLRSGPAHGTHGHRVARLADVHVESLVLELRDLVAARGDRPTGPVARLFAYDEQHHANLVDTLRAWLDAFGDVIAASAAMYVHPNTFRYRLRRLAEVGGLDLTDPEARFAAMLQLRVITPGAAADRSR
ncbi:PucR family transcriptional regulator [Catellatospora paridis]|uniref:PucR family transcriptional regulator n=1 Tax=Catellatospora paridis TaxID=1617086 RepID=UPI001E4921A7|nr:helix-turn-helix domain-containing protein [Catellatospora paridis]